MEREKRLLVIVLALLLLRLWFVVPYIAVLDTGQTEYAALQRSVKKAERLMLEMNNQDEYLENIAEVSRKNSTSLMGVEGETRDALAALQKKIRTFLEEMDFEVSSVTWGEPYGVEGERYMRLPLSFSASSSSSGMHKFLELIGRHKPLIIFDSLTIRSHRNKLNVQGQVIAFTRLNESRE